MTTVIPRRFLGACSFVFGALSLGAADPVQTNSPSASPAKADEEVVELSPFEVRADKDRDVSIWNGSQVMVRMNVFADHWFSKWEYEELGKLPSFSGP